MLWNMIVMLRTFGPLKRLREQDGMEMVEWAIVATVFAVASAALWTTLSGAIGAALTTTSNTVNP
jgi:Flp pilus assembly pilin Flp